MRHPTITLTMNTYGHLFPGQEAETVARFPAMVIDPFNALRATGTTDATADGAQRSAQNALMHSPVRREALMMFRESPRATPVTPCGLRI